MKKKLQQITVLHEDEDIIVVNKPPRLLTVPDRYAPEKPNLYHWLQKRQDDKVFIVHRLDKETSGIIVFAKNETAHRHLSIQFEKRQTDKSYLTLVDGQMYKEEGVIEKPIALHKNGKRMLVTRSGKPSVTEYKVLESFKRFTLVEAMIKTGRLHQIRIHFESIGYPLAIDAIYGKREGLYLSEVKGKRYNLGKYEEEKYLMDRVILHAWKLGITHPRTEEQVEFEAELPKDFSAVLKQLRKWGANK